MQMPEMLDNVSKTVKDDLTVSINKGDKLSIAAACFSIYAYQALKKQLDGIAELRFIFTSPTFLSEKAPKEKREFYIPCLGRERSLYGTEFEVKLRNELTQKAIARECSDWIRKKAQFRSNLTGGNINGFMNVEGSEATDFKESKIWSMLYTFQKDAVLAIINKLESYNGCILADSVGLGKTFTALAVIKYHENRNRSVLVLCPKKLSDNWNTYKDNYVNNPIATDRLRYDVLYHTDLFRDRGKSNGLDLDRLNWGNYDLVVIDESHNFRNGGGSSDSKLFRNKHEHILRFAKNITNVEINGVPVNNEDWYKSQDIYVKTRGKYHLQKLGMGAIQYSASLDYPISTPDRTTVMPADNNSGRKACWRWSKQKYEWGVANGFIEIKKDNSGVWPVYSKQYLNCDNEGNTINRTQRPMGIIDEFSSTQASKMLENMGLGSAFSYSKPVDLMKYLISRMDMSDEYILDFFSGSATTAHAVLQLNAEGTEAAIAGYDNICEIGKERVRLAEDKIKAQEGLPTANLDIGFRALKLDDTNMNDVYYAAGDYTQELVLAMESNIKPDRTDLNLLYGCLLDWGLPRSMSHTHEKIDSLTVHTYNNGDLIACCEEKISEKAIREIASRKPLRAVFRNSGFTSSPEKINVFEIFKLLAPNTNVRVI